MKKTFYPWINPVVSCLVGLYDSLHCSNGMDVRFVFKRTFDPGSLLACVLPNPITVKTWFGGVSVRSEFKQAGYKESPNVTAAASLSKAISW